MEAYCTELRQEFNRTSRWLLSADNETALLV